MGFFLVENKSLNIGPVTAVDECQLCPATAAVSGPEAMKTLLAGIPSRSCKSILVRQSKIFEDIEICLEDDLYHTVFRDDREKALIMDTVSDAGVPEETIAEFRFLNKIDSYSYRHILVLTALATRMALDLSYEDEDLLFLVSACLTHDYGKSRISPEILCSNAFLTDGEIEQIKVHPIISWLLACYYYQSDSASRVALSHHEKRNGSGYPFATRVSDRNVEIIQICDMFDALISPRPYRKAPFKCREALDHLAEEALTGSVDGDLVKLLISYVRSDRPHWQDVRLSKGRTSILGKQGTYRHIK